MTLSRTLSANPGGWSSVDDVQLTGTPTWTLTHCDADVRNLSAKVLRGRWASGEDALNLVAELERGPQTVKWDVDADQVLRSIMWASPEQVMLARTYGGVVIQDNTCLTNRYDFKLCLYVGVDSENKTIVFAQGFLGNEQSETFDFANQFFLEICGGHPKAFDRVWEGVKQLVKGTACEKYVNEHLYRQSTKRASLGKAHVENDIKRSLEPVLTAYEKVGASKYAAEEVLAEMLASSAYETSVLVEGRGSMQLLQNLAARSADDVSGSSDDDIGRTFANIMELCTRAARKYTDNMTKDTRPGEMGMFSELGRAVDAWARRGESNVSETWSGIRDPPLQLTRNRKQTRTKDCTESGRGSAKRVKKE
eukprot:jgi/Undpi1/7598/HiC_scaffold_23.g10071.m1